MNPENPPPKIDDVCDPDYGRLKPMIEYQGFSVRMATCLAVVALGLVGCKPPPPQKPPDAVKLVGATIDKFCRVEVFKWADFDGGVAVLADGVAAYWVCGGKVYAANDIAKGWSPGIEGAPLGIDHKTVAIAVGWKRE